MAGLFDKQAATYLEARPKFPKEWFSMLSGLTPSHTLAWDVGTGNGQAALGVAEHYGQVIATDISEEQIKHAIAHPRIRYAHTPGSMSDDDVISLIGGENRVDLVTVSVAVHWFELQQFYSLVRRVLKNPGGVIAVWTYALIRVEPELDAIIDRFYDRALRFTHPKAQYAFEGYKTLPFPFESVGVGSEGHPRELDMFKEMSFDGFLKLISSSSGVTKAKTEGVDLLSEDALKELELAWGGKHVVRTVNFKTFMLAGKV